MLWKRSSRTLSVARCRSTSPIRIYERGEALKAHCDRLLKAAEDKVEKIRLARDGKPAGTEPLDAE